MVIDSVGRGKTRKFLFGLYCLFVKEVVRLFVERTGRTVRSRREERICEYFWEIELIRG